MRERQRWRDRETQGQREEGRVRKRHESWAWYKRVGTLGPGGTGDGDLEAPIVSSGRQTRVLCKMLSLNVCTHTTHIHTHNCVYLYIYDKKWISCTFRGTWFSFLLPVLVVQVRQSFFSLSIIICVSLDTRILY